MSSRTRRHPSPSREDRSGSAASRMTRPATHSSGTAAATAEATRTAAMVAMPAMLAAVGRRARRLLQLSSAAPAGGSCALPDLLRRPMTRVPGAWNAESGSTLPTRSRRVRRRRTAPVDARRPRLRTRPQRPLIEHSAEGAAGLLVRLRVASSPGLRIALAAAADEVDAGSGRRISAEATSAVREEIVEPSQRSTLTSQAVFAHRRAGKGSVVTLSAFRRRARSRSCVKAP